MKELLQVIFEEVAVSMPANPVRFVRDTMHAMLGSDASEAEAKEASGGCFLRVHVECGFRGQRVWEHVSRRAPGKGFKAGSMREWRREASGVLAALVGSLLGDAEGEGTSPETGKPLDDQVRALQEKVREVEEGLREARAELEKAGEVAADLRARLAQAEAELQGGGVEEDASGAGAAGSWEPSGELRVKLREVFDKMDLNKDGVIHEADRAETSGLLNELHVEFGLRAEVVFETATTFDQFEARLVREWEVTCKEQALAGVNVARVVAELLPGGSPGAPMEHLEGLSGQELRRFCRTSVAAGVEKLLRQQQETLREGRGRGDGDSKEQGNAKFAQGGKVLGQARFGKLADFTSGLLSKLGLPDPRLMKVKL